MKASELRINNYVYHSPFPHVHEFSIIQSIKKDINGDFEISHGNGLNEVIYCGLDEYQPIPLTAPWLERFGFENGGYEQLEWRIGKFWIAGYGDSFGRTYDAHGANKGLNVELQFVHQLQNLYFALTGKELEIIA